MKLLQNPYINAAVITIISVFYAAIFIITSGHVEFLGMLDHGQTLSSAFWNGWTVFLKTIPESYFKVADKGRKEAVFCRMYCKKTVVQIRIAAPQNARFSPGKQAFSLLFATIFDDLNFSFCL